MKITILRNPDGGLNNMVQVFSANGDGSVSKLGSNNYWVSNEVSGKATSENKDGSWKSLHGITILVSKDGTIEKGPEAFVGKSINDISRLHFSDVFKVVRNEQAIKEIISKSLLIGPTQISRLSEEDQIRIKSIQEENEYLVDEKVELSKKLEDSKKDPLYL